MYDEKGNELNLTYAKYLDTSGVYNSSLDKNIALYYKEDDVRIAKDNIKSLQPAEVSVFYDLNGNIINPGINIDDEGNILTSSSAIYDSEDVIYDNLFRSISVIRDLSKVYYQNEDNSYTLYDAKTNWVYTVILENKKYYFSSHDSAYKYIKDYVSMNSLKIHK